LKNKLFQNLSANTLQLVVNQLAGLAIFYLLSTGLDKNNFGQLNLALAILMMAFNLLSLGIDQVAIRKIASGEDAGEVLSLYLFHVLFSGLLFYGILFAGSIFIPQTDIYPLLLLIGAGKLMIYFSTPFKQAASGMERFKLLGMMLVISNLVRSIALLILVLTHVLSLQTTVIVFIIGDVLELLCCILFFSRSMGVPVTVQFNKKKYFALLREALPQTGVNLLTSAMARFDWVFIGFMASAVKLAEYSFAYKVFEMSTLPLLAIAPLLIPRFTKLFKQAAGIDTENLKHLVRAEMIIAAFTSLALNMLWAPVIDALTHGKYGAVNSGTLFLLTLCIPFLYLNNFLWTIYFAQGRMQMILKGFILTFTVNAGLDILLIPVFGNEGAAAGFLASCLVQAAFYLYNNRIPQLNSIWQNLAICMVCALVSGFAASIFHLNCWIALAIASILYVILLLITRQIKPADRKVIGAAFAA
jgi:O-antigen/teichoic acid export membrane protein